jgi:mannose-6-phosphate isomerase-like protein (cupin superfamily)
MKTTIKFPGVIALFMMATISTQSHAQQPTVDHFSKDDLLHRAGILKALADAGTGSASTKLDEYPNHYTMIALREKDGGAEIHEEFADIFVILKGQATLMTGGTVVDAKTVKPGEITGAKLTGGSATELSEGDVVHIPARLPHQMLLSKGGELVYVIKVKES